MSLRPRLTPCLLIHKGGLVKTEKFTKPKYVGDPINAVRIFNEKMVDELIVIDIDATREGRDPDYKMISNLANECRMPLCYGGGVKTPEQIRRITGLGVEKVAISSAAIENLDLIREAAEQVGSQSIVVVLDIKRTGFRRQPEVVTLNATHRTGHDPVELARKVQEAGAGELVVNFVDRDGTMTGYDLEYIEKIRSAITLPLTVLGGAGSLGDIEKLFSIYQIIGAAAGSLFVFKGKFRAVLINYPNPDEKRALIERVKKHHETDTSKPKGRHDLGRGSSGPESQ